MRKILFILMLISIYCRVDCENNDRRIDENNVTTQEIDSIIGDWDISKSMWTETKHEKGKLIKTEAAAVCNVCPTIIFKKCGKGILRKANRSESSFNWAIYSDKIHFSFDKKEDETEFFSLDKEFRFKIYHDSKIYYFELIQEKEGDKYLLLRGFKAIEENPHAGAGL